MQIIQGSKFAEYFICYKPEVDNTFLKRFPHEHYYDNTLNINQLNNGDVIYCKIDFVEQLFEVINDIKVSIKLVTHNGDNPVNEKIYKDKPPCVKAWWGQNISFSDDKLFSLPIGLENIWWRNGDQYNMISKDLQFKNLKLKKTFKNLLYINHASRPGKRAEAYTYFESATWATKQKPTNLSNYYNEIKTHMFVLCPDGNGIDTHRLWETLYLGAIPVVFESINANFYRDLPICFINSYSDITQTFLEEERKRILNSNWNYDKLDLSYWINTIVNFDLALPYPTVQR